MGFRPEAFDLVEGPGDDVIPVQVNLVEELGSDAFMYGDLVGGGALSSGSSSNPDEEEHGQVVIRTAPRTAPQLGSVVYGKIRPGMLHLFSKSTGMRLPA